MKSSLTRSRPTSNQARHAVLRAFRRHSACSPSAEAEPSVRLAPPASGVVEHGNLSTFLGWAAVAFFVLAVVRRAWISDDAFITMRAVDHLIQGRGFVYNADERVLGFTNPLWALLLTIPYLLVREPYLAPILGSIVVSGLVGACIAFRGSSDRRVGALVLLALCFSRAFVDFSTSGLENPLTHLLLVLFYIEFLKGEGFSILYFSLLAALSIVNRFDSLPLLLPPLISVYRHRMTPELRRSVLIGWSPAILWLLFAIVYYGFPLPNTAYAKLNTEIPQSELFIQGLSYLVDALVSDPQTIIVIFAAIVVLVVLRNKVESAIVALLALGLEIAYVVLIGGDFMSGRFLTPAVAVSAVVLGQFGGPWLSEPARLRAAAACLAVVVVSLSFSPLRDDPIREKRDFPVTRIVNERAWFQEHLTLNLNLRPVQWKTYGLYGDGRAAREKHRKVVLYNNVGMFAWGVGPAIHVVDDMALTDPLLARIPFVYRDDWRSGHLPRSIPEGYLDSLESGTNVIRDPCIASYFDRLNSVVRGPLFSAERWAAILTLNLPGGMTVTACPDRIAEKAVPAQPAPQPPPPSEAAPPAQPAPSTK